MKTLLLFSIVLASIVALNANQHDAKFGKYTGNHALMHKHITQVIEDNLIVSYRYLMLSSYFGNYMKNRDGMKKLFRELSDESWEHALKLIKHELKRGYDMTSLNLTKKFGAELLLFKGLNTNELEAMEEALDIEKKLADKTHDIISHKDYKGNKPDPELVSFLENELLHEQTDIIRKLAGHVNDLNRLKSGESTENLQVTLFDEYLKNM